jgi:hypothetical protein
MQNLCKEDRAIGGRACVVEDCGVVVEEDGAEQDEGTPGTIFRGEWWQWESDPWQSESRQREQRVGRANGEVAGVCGSDKLAKSKHLGIQ